LRAISSSREQTSAAIARGIFGAPSLLVEEELFWGSDRLEQALARGLAFQQLINRSDEFPVPPEPFHIRSLDRPSGMLQARLVIMSPVRIGDVDFNVIAVAFGKPRERPHGVGLVENALDHD